MKVLYILLILLTPVSQGFANNKSLTILAEPNLTKLTTELARAYSIEHNSTVSVNYDNASELIESIEYGESADIYLSSHPSWIAELKRLGLIDIYSIYNIAKNRLALVTSKDSDIKDKLLDYNVILVRDANTTSLGKYTDSALDNSIYDTHEKYYRYKNDKDTVLNIVKKNKNHVGIVFYNNAENDDDIRVITIFEDDVNDTIFYQAGVIAGENMEEARKFIQFLQTDRVKNILARNHFINLNR